MRRMDRYKDETPDRPNRYEKNQELYQDIASNTKYTNITDVTNSNAFEINGFKNKGSYTSRESYQQMKKYKNVESVPRIKKELDDFNYLYKIDDKKVYDINIVLEEARKNRQEKDKLDIIINKHVDSTDKLIENMLNCLNEIANQYPKNVKIINREE